MDYFGETSSQNMPRHFFWGCRHLEHSTAVKADVSRQNYSVLPRHWYVDATFECVECHQLFCFTALEQQHWYEELGFYVDSYAKRCPNCRKNQRRKRELRQRYDRDIDSTIRSSDPTAKSTLAEVIDELISMDGDLPKKIHENRKLLAAQVARHQQLEVAMTSHIADELLTIVRLAEPTLRSLTDDIVSTQPAPDRWTIKEVVGHLIDSAANNHQRFVRAQFTTRLVFPKYEQNEWVGSQHYRDADWQEVVNLWAAYNRHLAHVIKNADKNALNVECKIGDDDLVTLQFLMEDYVTHLKHHLQKIAERLKMDPSKLGG